jgi:hypothetical protein
MNRMIAISCIVGALFAASPAQADPMTSCGMKEAAAIGQHILHLKKAPTDIAGFVDMSNHIWAVASNEDKAKFHKALDMMKSNAILCGKITISQVAGVVLLLQSNKYPEADIPDWQTCVPHAVAEAEQEILHLKTEPSSPTDIASYATRIYWHGSNEDRLKLENAVDVQSLFADRCLAATDAVVRNWEMPPEHLNDDPCSQHLELSNARSVVSLRRLWAALHVRAGTSWPVRN